MPFGPNLTNAKLSPKYCMEAFIDLPEFQVINQVIRPQRLDITFNESGTLATSALASVPAHRAVSPS
jgi:hypothetical protein